MARPTKYNEEIAEVMAKVEVFKESHKKLDNGCWEWTGYYNNRGYGLTSFDGRTWLAHRVAYFLNCFKIPPIVMHKCDNTKCVNPDHLKGGTQKDNMDDMWAKGRGKKGENHCNAKLSDEQVKEIRESKERGYLLAKEYGVSQSCVCNIRSGRSRG